MYHFPGRYQKTAPGTDLTKLRIEYEEAAFQEITGSSNCADFAAGTCFSVANGDKASTDKQFMLTAVHHTARDWGVVTQDDQSTYTNRFCCLPRTLPYRPPMKTPRPRISGTQTAIVTGPSGAEICTDRYGRIKVQFHWDRYGKRNDHSSCWIRVAQSWAGRGWGGWTLPRIGQEVVVSFLEGDPDRPLVVGSVYNAEQTVPFSLPANATQIGLRTRSSMGGSAANCNELRFEDKKGSEQVYFHAERNLDTSVELNESHSVGADQSFTVGHDRSKTIARDETTQVGRDRTETVGRNETVTVALMRTHTVGVSDTLTVGAARVHSVGATEAITVGGSQTTSIGKNSSLSVGKDQTISVGGNETVSVGKDRSTSIGQGETLDVGKTITISAGEQIMLQTGSAKLTMLKNGDITIEGNQITIKGSGNVVIKGQKILQN
jgi:type VI secretion system secreted protein VgrG